MKNFLLFSMMCLSLSTYANIDYDEADRNRATESEISNNRACFENLKVQGCGDPGEDPQQFRSCMKNVRETLSTYCQAKMTELYGK